MLRVIHMPTLEYQRGHGTERVIHSAIRDPKSAITLHFADFARLLAPARITGLY
jgi:hypothetical protein